MFNHPGNIASRLITTPTESRKSFIGRSGVQNMERAIRDLVLLESIIRFPEQTRRNNRWRPHHGSGAGEPKCEWLDSFVLDGIVARLGFG